MTDNVEQAAERLFSLMERPARENAFTKLGRLLSMWSAEQELEPEPDPDPVESPDLVGLLSWDGEWVSFDYE